MPQIEQQFKQLTNKFSQIYQLFLDTNVQTDRQTDRQRKV